MKELKVAIIIPGQARFFKNNDILNLKDKYNADIFIHTWSGSKERYTAPYNTVDTIITDKDVTDYIDMYKPYKFLIEKELDNDYIDKFLIKREIKRGSSQITKYNMFRYFYSLEKAYSLIEDKYKYDFVIITRSDMVDIKIPDLHTLETNMIYTPTGNRDNRYGNNNHCYIDLNLMIIPPMYLSLYSDLHNRMDRYYDKGYDYGWDEMFYAHMFESKLFNKTIFLEIRKEIYFELKRDENGIKPRHCLF